MEQETVPLTNNNNTHNAFKINYSITKLNTFCSILFSLFALTASLISISLILWWYSRSINLKNEMCRIAPLTCHDQNQITSDTLNENPPKNVLVIVAHPDDAEMCGGGTIAKWIQQGSEIRYIVLTNGDKGTRNISESPQHVSMIRQHEQLCASSVLGVKSVDFLNISDGEVSNNEETRRQVVYFIRKYKPDAIITWNPMRHLRLYNYYFEHDDHQTTGSIVLSACYPRARDVQYYKEQIIQDGLNTHHVKTIYMFSWFQYWNDEVIHGKPIVISITEQQMETKLKALMCHASQVGTIEETKEFLFNMASSLAKSASGISIQPLYSEYFLRVIMPE